MQMQSTINREIPRRMKALHDNPGPRTVLFSMLAALAYGVFHTIGPGHGKTVIATYFLTHGVRWRRGLLIAAQVAVTHVIGAVVLVLSTQLLLTQILTGQAQQIYWLQVVSYTLILAIGAYLLTAAMQHLANHSHQHTGCLHCAQQQQNPQATLPLAIGIGIVPCTGSLLILLYAMANNMLGLGLLMVACVALGMAAAMMAIGLLCIWGRQQLVGKAELSGTFTLIMEAIGGLLICLIGLSFLSLTLA